MQTYRRLGAWSGFAALVLAGAFAPSAEAGQYQCNHRPVTDGRKPCPDGSPPTYVATSIEPNSSRSAQPSQERPVQPERGGVYDGRDRYDGARGRFQRDDRGRGRGVELLLGAWRTNVSGATWIGPADQWGYATQHTSAGAIAGALVIRPDHTFAWGSAYCARNLGWIDTGDPAKPITLRCIEKGKPKAWSVALDDRHPGQIWVWDEWGVSYTGRR